MDRFNRIVKDRWAKDGGSDLYSTDITFDESGNITRQVDNLHRNYSGASNPGVFDASYTIDSRSRLTRTQEGHWNGGSISTLWRDQQWTLSQTGNWAREVTFRIMRTLTTGALPLEGGAGDNPFSDRRARWRA